MKAVLFSVFALSALLAGVATDAGYNGTAYACGVVATISALAALFYHLEGK